MRFLFVVVALAVGFAVVIGYAGARGEEARLEQDGGRVCTVEWAGLWWDTVCVPQP